MHNIPILHNIRLAFLAILPRRLDRPHALAPRAQVVEVLVGDDFGFDEAAFEIIVNATG